MSKKLFTEEEIIILKQNKYVKKVYYIDDKYADTDSTKASKYMFEKAKVECIKLEPKVNKIEIVFKYYKLKEIY